MSARLQIGSFYRERLMNLHTERRLLIVSIEDEKRLGRPTKGLEADLAGKQRETNAFLAYLSALP
jgi:hypothetical protein